ncbi:class I SAM-dependent methyltransferase [Aurantiacibacter luteus]|nr:class I SAM-dependent methyltransferase [Aurantiacibacter luteus]
MGLRHWYDETIVPKVVAAGCGTEEVARLRREVVPLARGAVFEIGCGGGYNQPLYDESAICSFSGIDPNGALLEAARKSAADKGWEVDIREGKGEAIPFHDGAFDTVVCTYTLCSVDDAPRVLSEVRRVLKPGGRLLFLEHGRAPDPVPAKWQRRIEPVWKRLAGNCHLTREIGGAIRAAGFEVEPIGRGYFEQAPKWAGWMEWGTARRAGA